MYVSYIFRQCLYNWEEISAQNVKVDTDDTVCYTPPLPCPEPPEETLVVEDPRDFGHNGRVSETQSPAGGRGTGTA